METNAQYYRRRAAEEQLAAEHSATLPGRNAHRDLASRYEKIVAAQQRSRRAAE